jgi:hypothetical protein
MYSINNRCTIWAFKLPAEEYAIKRYGRMWTYKDKCSQKHMKILVK